MFRLHQKYIFLLILGLILEIFSSLALWEAPLSYAAWPLLGIVGAAGFLEGLGIVLFMVQVRRMAGQGRSAGRLALLGALAAVFFWQATMLLGLADYWLDFRRLDRLRRRTDTGARDPQD